MKLQTIEPVIKLRRITWTENFADGVLAYPIKQVDAHNDTVKLEKQNPIEFMR